MPPADQETLNALEVVLSTERFGTYLTAAGHDPQRALRLYLWNAQLGEAFHTPIQAVEVGLRNRIGAHLCRTYGPDWWQNQAFLATLDGERKADLELVFKRIKKRALPRATGQVIAGLSFGFWVGLLQKRYNPTLWGGRLQTAFPSLPATETRQELANRVGKVAFLRNRISHHEPLIKRNVSADYANIRSVIEWICPLKWEWIKPYCRVPAVMRSKP